MAEELEELDELDLFHTMTDEFDFDHFHSAEDGLLAFACLAGDIVEATNLLSSEGVTVNHINQRTGATPLHTVCAKGHVDVLKELLKRPELLVNQPDYDRTTPLYMACQENHVHVVQELFKHDGLQVNLAQAEGATPLYAASQFGHVDVVQVLLTRTDLLLNQPFNDGATPLFIACQNNKVRVVRALLDRTLVRIHGMQGRILVNQACVNGETPLYIACERGYCEVVHELLKRGDIQVNRARKNGGTPLQAACQFGHLEAVQVLLASKEMLVNQADTSGATALFFACVGGHLNIIQELLKVDRIQVNAANKRGTTPLYAACGGGWVEVVKELLNADGIAINQADKEERTPLYIACKNEHLPTVKILMATPVVSAQNDVLWCKALRACANSSNIELIMLFLQKGIGHNLVNKWFGFTYIYVSKRIALYQYALRTRQQHRQLLDFHLCVLNTHHATASTSALKAFKVSWPPLVGDRIASFLLPSFVARSTLNQVMIEFQNTLNDEDKVGFTQLSEAVGDIDVDVVQFLLLQEGIDVNKYCDANEDLEEGEEEEENETCLDLIDRKLDQHNSGLGLSSSSAPIEWHLSQKEQLDCARIRELLVAAGGLFFRNLGGLFESEIIVNVD